MLSSLFGVLAPFRRIPDEAFARVPQLMLRLDTESGGDLRERRKPPGQACVQAVMFVLVRTLLVADRVR